MNIAVIFAGGAGVRMNTKSRPKQFLELNGKPIIIYTLELFDNHPQIDAIVVACLKEWIPFLKKMLKKFEINKVVSIVEGGDTGQASIYNGLEAAELFARKQDSAAAEPPIVLIHDGATETLVVQESDGSLEIPTRAKSKIARAPQSFYLKDIIAAHRRAREEGREDFIDSCSMMSHYGYKLGLVMGPMENIKITTPTDFFLFRAMVQVHENQQIFGF